MQSEQPEPDEGTEGAVLPSDGRVRQLEDLRAGNKREVQALAAEGVMVSAEGLRLEVLLDAIFDAEDRLEFELLFHRRLQESLRTARQKANVARLTRGMNGRPT